MSSSEDLIRVIQGNPFKAAKDRDFDGNTALQIALDIVCRRAEPRNQDAKSVDGTNVRPMATSHRNHPSRLRSRSMPMSLSGFLKLGHRRSVGKRKSVTARPVVANNPYITSEVIYLLLLRSLPFDTGVLGESVGEEIAI